jgi:hypothetical protein
MKLRRNQELFARTLMLRTRGEGIKDWARTIPEPSSPAAIFGRVPYWNGLRPLPKGGCDNPNPQTRRRIRQYPLLGTGTALFYDAVLDRAHSRLRP